MAKRSPRTSRTPRAGRPTRPPASTARDRRASQPHRPLPPQPGFEPPPGTLGLEATAALRPRDFKADKPLACATTNPEWSLELCRVKEAWALTPPTPHGRIKGEGIVIGHPDTGYTKHAEPMGRLSREGPRALLARLA